MTEAEEQLVRRFRSREPGSVDALYTAYGTRIYRFCCRLTGNASDAEDLVQEVFVAAFQTADQFEGRSSITTWLYRIAVFRWNALRARRTVETVPFNDAFANPEPTADYSDRESVRLGLAGALEAIPPAQREAIVLVRGEGLRCREAAEVLGIPESTLKFRIHQAAVALQRLLLPGHPGASRRAANGSAKPAKSTAQGGLS